MYALFWVMHPVELTRNSILDNIYFSIIVIRGKSFLSEIFLSKLKAFT